MTFPAYPGHKASGVEWLGDVPIDWTLSKVKYDSYVKARVGWHGLKSDEFTDVGPYLVTGSDFKNRTVEWASCYHCTNERFEQDKYIQLEEGDLLITKDGTIGKLILVEGLPGKATLNSGIFVVRPLRQKYSTRFYFWIMQSSVFHEFIGLNKTGSTIIHLYQETFENLPYALPPPAEQTQIARFLDHETARIDALIEEQQRLIELLKEKRQAVISHAVTKGLDPTVPMKDSGVEWLGEVPVHWVVSRVKNVASFITSGPRGWSDYIDESGEDIFLQSGDMDNRLNVLLDKAKRIITPEGAEGIRTRLQDGDVVVCITGANTGRVAVLGKVGQAAYVNQHLGLVRPYVLACNSRYLGYALSSSACQTYFNIEQYGLKEGLSLSDLAEAPLMVPPLAEQVKLVEVIENQLGNLDGLTADSEMTVELLQERRSALISAAVTGKIDVRGWQFPVSAQAPELEVAEAV